MNNITKFLLTGLLFVIAVLGFAQNNNSMDLESDAYLSKKFKLQTHQLAQFIDRFNFTEPILIEQQIPSRAKNLLMLLNYSDTALIQKIKTLDFINQIVESDVKLSLDNDNWFAKVACEFSFKKKPLQVFLYMKRKGNPVDGYSWRIAGVEASIFSNNKKTERNGITYINPLNNEVNFSELSKIFGSKADVSAYYQDGFEYNALNTFRDYILNEDLIFSHVQDIQYHFKNVAGYYITIDNFIRMETNAGWLISNIKK